MSDSFWANLPMLITAVVSGIGAILAAIWARQAREVTKVGNTQAAETAATAAVARKSIEQKIDQNNHLATQGIKVTQDSAQIVVDKVAGNSNLAPLTKS